MSDTLFGVSLPPRRGFSVPIQVLEEGGVTAWLVEERSLPVVSVAWAWAGGAARDPEGREGLHGMAAALLTEGAGDLSNIAFADAARDAGIGLGFSGGRDSFEGSFRTLSPALPEALRLARLAMTAPRLDESALARVRARAVLSARQALETPAGLARREFWQSAYPGHPAGRQPTPESLSAVTREEVRAALDAQMRRRGILLTAAGDIGPDGLRDLIRALFAPLPQGAPEPVPPLPAPERFGIKRVEKAAPQSTLFFGQDALLPTDPDWEAFQVALRILAGGGFTSRLTRTIREERGLTYGIGAGLDLLFGRAVVVGQVQTDNATVGEVWRLLREGWAAMAAEGPTEEEVRDAVAFLSGSLPLQFTDTRRTASLLLGLRQAGRDPAWLEGRPARLAALTRDDVARAAKRLDPGALSLAVAGEPQGL
ncbi:M16 family metallopeptidase [Sabulicella rubraurantiaca]|uniref:M16 family metallopeptidase n=1 Tax=Sabulicella rubraurantiaca TaxID=2811429 RepID=UPI001A978A79|nr:pitrilysin family protein [Sabulicella rubraurantiaca]